MRVIARSPGPHHAGRFGVALKSPVGTDTAAKRGRFGTDPAEGWFGMTRERGFGPVRMGGCEWSSKGEIHGVNC